MPMDSEQTRLNQVLTGRYGLRPGFRRRFVLQVEVEHVIKSGTEIIDQRRIWLDARPADMLTLGIPLLFQGDTAKEAR